MRARRAERIAPPGAIREGDRQTSGTDRCRGLPGSGADVMRGVPALRGIPGSIRVNDDCTDFTNSTEAIIKDLLAIAVGWRVPGPDLVRGMPAFAPFTVQSG